MGFSAFLQCDSLGGSKFAPLARASESASLRGGLLIVEFVGGCGTGLYEFRLQVAGYRLLFQVQVQEQVQMGHAAAETVLISKKYGLFTC